MGYREALGLFINDESWRKRDNLILVEFIYISKKSYYLLQSSKKEEKNKIKWGSSVVGSCQMTSGYQFLWTLITYHHLALSLFLRTTWEVQGLSTQWQPSCSFCSCLALQLTASPLHAPFKTRSFDPTWTTSWWTYLWLIFLCLGWAPPLPFAPSLADILFLDRWHVRLKVSLQHLEVKFRPDDNQLHQPTLSESYCPDGVDLSLWCFRNGGPVVSCCDSLWKMAGHLQATW